MTSWNAKSFGDPDYNEMGGGHGLCTYYHTVVLGVILFIIRHIFSPSIELVS